MTPVHVQRQGGELEHGGCVAQAEEEQGPVLRVLNQKRWTEGKEGKQTAVGAVGRNWVSFDVPPEACG